MGPQEEAGLKKEFLQHIKYYRHDFLNDIQLIKGYLSLGKKDKAQEYLDQVVLQAQDDSKVFQIGDPRLAYFLLAYNFKQHKVQLDVNIEMDREHIPHIGTKHPSLFRILQKITGLLEEGCQAGAENHLGVLFSGTEGEIITTLEFEGGWASANAIKRLNQLQETIPSERGKLMKCVHDHDHLMLSIEIYS